MKKKAIRKAVCWVSGGQWPASNVTAALHQAGYAVTLGSEDDAIQSELDAAIFVQSPSLDAPHAVRHVRAARGARYLPVVVLMPPGQKAAWRDAWAAGADHVLSHPTDEEELISCVEHGSRIRQLLSPTAEDSTVRNPQVLERRLREEVRRSLRYEAPLSLLLLGSDRTEGWMEQSTASVWATLRKTDLCGRYQEWVAVVLTHTPLNGSLSVAERMSTGIPQDVGIGIATLPNRHVASAGQLVQGAVQALRAALVESNGRISVYTPNPSLLL